MPFVLRFTMDEAFVYVSVISGIFGLIGLQLLTHNWFRKERFKVETYNLKRQNDLQLKKMAKDLGLSLGKSTPQNNINAPGPLDNIGNLLTLAKGLSPEQLQGIIGIVTGQGGGNIETGDVIEESEGGLEGVDGLVDFATKNPEIVKSFLGGLKNGPQGQQNNTGSQV